MTKPVGIPRLSDRQIRYYLYRIYRLLESDEVNFTIARMKRVIKSGRKQRLAGLSSNEEPQGLNIWLSPDHDILPSLIHECLHLLYWHKEENWVASMERRITKRISEVQMRKLLLLLAEQIQLSKQVPYEPIDANNSASVECPLNKKFPI